MMKVLSRLLEESESELERALLRAGSSYPNTAKARTRILAALGLAGSTTLSTAGASAALLENLGWNKLVAISAIAATAVVPAAYFALQADGPEEPAGARAPASSGGPPFTVLDDASTPAESSSEDPALPRAEPSPERIPHRSPVASAPTPPRVTLGDELAALERARSALLEGNSASALSLLDAYGRRFPRGKLKLEAEVLRIDALFRSRQAGVARKRAEAFLERHPNSVLASRVRGYL